MINNLLIGYATPTNSPFKPNTIYHNLNSYDFAPDSGTCQLIYISPDLEETVLAENEDGSVTVRLQPGANYIGIYGNDYSGSIQITIE